MNNNTENYITFLEQLINEKLRDIQVAAIGSIESFDPELMRADVKPLQSRKIVGEQTEYSILSNVPVNFLITGEHYIRPEYQKGDLVTVVFPSRDIAMSLLNQAGQEGRLFSPENAVIVGGVAPKDYEAPSEFSETGLLIGQRNGSAYTRIEEDKFTFTFGSTVIELSTDGMVIDLGSTTMEVTSSGVLLKVGTTEVELGSAGVTATLAGLKYDLATHQHPTATPGPPSPPTPG